VAQVSITAEHRSDFGKGAARRTRRAGRVPAVIYGQGQELQHVSLPDHELTLALRHPGLVLEVTLDGKKHLVAPRDVQRDPVKRVLEHVDLVLITKAEAAERIEEGLAAEAAHEAAMNEKPSNEEMDLERHDDSAPVAEVGEETPEA
jgi:ribosomal protein L25 (general stress protein Ctc)